MFKKFMLCIYALGVSQASDINGKLEIENFYGAKLAYSLTNTVSDKFILSYNCGVAMSIYSRDSNLLFKVNSDIEVSRCAVVLNLDTKAKQSSGDKAASLYAHRLDIMILKGILESRNILVLFGMCVSPLWITVEARERATEIIKPMSEFDSSLSRLCDVSVALRGLLKRKDWLFAIDVLAGMTVDGIASHAVINNEKKIDTSLINSEYIYEPLLRVSIRGDQRLSDRVLFGMNASFEGRCNREVVRDIGEYNSVNDLSSIDVNMKSFLHLLKIGIEARIVYEF